MDCSWNNPQQYRTAFDFLGALAPAADFRKMNHAGNNTNPYVIDDFNYLPYFQGISAEFICLKQDGNVWGDQSLKKDGQIYHTRIWIRMVVTEQQRLVIIIGINPFFLDF